MLEEKVAALRAIERGKAASTRGMAWAEAVSAMFYVGLPVSEADIDRRFGLPGGRLDWGAIEAEVLAAPPRRGV